MVEGSTFACSVGLGGVDMLKSNFSDSPPNKELGSSSSLPADLARDCMGLSATSLDGRADEWSCVVACVVASRVASRAGV